MSSVHPRWSFFLLGLAFLFTALSLYQLGLVNNHLELATFNPLFVLIICGGGTTYLLYRQWRMDPFLLPLVFFLCGWGLALTARLAPAFIHRQLFWLVIATTLLLAINLRPQILSWLQRYKYTWLIGGLILLSGTLIFGVNPSGFGARLWLPVLPTVYFQPSEPLKLLLVVFLAGYLADRRRQLVEVKAYIGGVAVPHPSYFGPMFLMWGFSIVLLVWQRDLGAALLFFGTFLGILYAATGQTRYIWSGAFLFIGAIIIGYYLFGVVRIRVDAFLNPWLDPAGSSFQIVQSLLAFASGGFLGQGLGQGLPTAIPVVHTDFVFAAIGEEYGLLGSAGVVLTFALLIGRAFHISLYAKNSFEQLLAVGIGTILGLQVIVITAGTLKLMPLTGVTLPFVSYGGSSLLTSFVMVGILLLISGRRSGRRKSFDSSRIYQSLALPPPVWLIPLRRLGYGLLFGFMIVTGGLVLWQILAGPFLKNREDNPRPIIAEQQIRRGRLLTAENIPVAETIIGPNGLAERHYPYVGLSSVTGYYSLRYGIGGTEATFDPILRGTADRTPQEIWLNDLLHRNLVGDDVTLTINLPAQVAADVALGTQEGAVVVMEIESGAILVMSSHPTYDPNQLDEIWDTLREDERAPLLNRATQGLFPVGDLARLIGLIGLYETGATLPPQPYEAPVIDMLEPLGEIGYLATAHQLGITRYIPGLRSLPGLLPDFDNRGTVRDLATTPLHLARVAAALEMEGHLPNPILSFNTEREKLPAVKATTVQYVRPLFSQIDEQLIGFLGYATPKETGQRFLSWFVGLAPTTSSPRPQRIPQDQLILDPTEIKTEKASQPTSSEDFERAQYVVVAVVVVDEPDSDIALQVAKAPLNVLLSEERK